MDVPPGSGVLRFGELALDLATGELRRPGDATPTVLGARPTRLLALLALRHGQLVTRDDIQSYVWSDGTTVDFYEGIDRRGFTFDNPNAVKSCGCGSSFQA